MACVVFEELGWRGYFEALRDADSASMSAAAYVECSVVVDSRREHLLSERFDRLVARLGIEIVQLTRQHADLAREAYRRYGKGSGHPAKLNFGDCFSYALAKERDEPLLFTGNDFIHTDVRAVPVM